MVSVTRDSEAPLLQRTGLPISAVAHGASKTFYLCLGARFSSYKPSVTVLGTGIFPCSVPLMIPPFWIGGPASLPLDETLARLALQS